MNRYSKLQQRAADNAPIRIGLIGAGKFGSMYLAQVPRTPGVHLVGIADLSPDAVRANLSRVGWALHRTQATSLDKTSAQLLRDSNPSSKILSRSSCTPCTFRSLKDFLLDFEPLATLCRGLDDAIRIAHTFISDDWHALVSHPAIDVIVECTGHPIAAVEPCLVAFQNGKHVVNVTIEADAFKVRKQMEAMFAPAQDARLAAE